MSKVDFKDERLAREYLNQRCVHPEHEAIAISAFLCACTIKERRIRDLEKQIKAFVEND